MLQALHNRVKKNIMTYRCLLWMLELIALLLKSLINNPDREPYFETCLHHTFITFKRLEFKVTRVFKGVVMVQVTDYTNFYIINRRNSHESQACHLCGLGKELWGESKAFLNMDQTAVLLATLGCSFTVVLNYATHFDCSFLSNSVCLTQYIHW